RRHGRTRTWRPRARRATVSPPYASGPASSNRKTRHREPSRFAFGFALILGAHQSSAGGLWRAFERGRENRCDAIQIFSRSSGQWAAKVLTGDDLRLFREARAGAGNPPMLIHDCYLINLASPDPALRRRSLAAFVEELRRAELLGVEHVVMHPGSPLGRGEEYGIDRVARALRRAL